MRRIKRKRNSGLIFSVLILAVFILSGAILSPSMNILLYFYLFLKYLWENRLKKLTYFKVCGKVKWQENFKEGYYGKENYWY